MSDAETEVFRMLPTILSNQTHVSWTPNTLELHAQLSPASICLDYTAESQVGEVAGTARLQRSVDAKYSILRN
jgi:hypothetical protein